MAFKSPKELAPPVKTTVAPAMTAKKGRGPDKKPRKKPLVKYFGGR